MDEHYDEEFPFDEWANLARHDPRAFESARRRLVQSLIESAPSSQRRRLAGLQWQIDIERARADNPLAACLKLSSMMWDQVLGEEGLLDGLDQVSGRRPLREKTVRQAVVLPFLQRSNEA